MVLYGGSPICAVHADMTLTRSKVKVKVTGLQKFRKLRLRKSISSASMTHSSKLMVDHGSMRPDLQLVGGRFLNFSPDGDHGLRNT